MKEVIKSLTITILGSLILLISLWFIVETDLSRNIIIVSTLGLTFVTMGILEFTKVTKQ